MTKNKDMVLYILDNNCLFYPMLVHCLSYNADKKVVLFVAKNIKIYDILGQFKKQKIFYDVVPTDLFYPKRNDNDFEEQDVINFFDSIISQIEYSLDSFSEICVLNDMWDGDINLYFNLIGQKYTWIESAPNSSNYKPIRVSEKMKSLMIKYNSLTPMAASANAVILEDSDTSKALLSSKKFSYWNIKSSVEKLPEDIIDKIALCYNINLTDSDKEEILNSTLVIQNSYGYALRATVDYKYKSRYFRNIIGYGEDINFGVAPYDKLASIMDRVAIDFYNCNSYKYYIKNHPNENSLTDDRVAKLYGEGFKSYSNMPFELIGKLYKNNHIKFNTILTYAHGLDTFDCDNQIVLGQNYVYTWFYYCSIYASILYAKSCGFTNIYCSPVLKEQIEFLSKEIDFAVDTYVINISNLNDICLLKNSLIICNYLDDKDKNIYAALLNLNASNVICFLNVELTEEFFKDDLYPYFVPITIKKTKKNNYTFNLQRDETIWVYSKNDEYRNASLNFSFAKNMHYSGYYLSVVKYSIFDAINLYRNKSHKQEMKIMQRNLNQTVKRINLLIAEDSRLSKSILSCENDMYRYVDTLRYVQNKYLVAFAVKDTPGDLISQSIIDLIKRNGLSNFSNKLWRMYIGVIYKGKILYDVSGNKAEEPVSFESDKDITDFHISVISCAYKQGNKAEIIINGTDYAVNIRGINIVVYDVENKKLIDSVAFDYHTENRVCKHRS